MDSNGSGVPIDASLFPPRSYQESWVLTPPPVRGVARVGHSHLGEGDFIRRLPALDPRLDRGENFNS